MSSVPYEKIVAEDLNTGFGTVDVTMPAGGTATGNKINQGSFPVLGFAAIGPGNQSLAASVVTTVELTSEEFDTQSWFTAYTYTPQVAGYYLVTGTVALASFTGLLTVGIYKDGVLVDSVTIPGTAQAVRAHITVLVVANGVTSAFTLRATQTDSSSKVVSAARMSAVCVGGL